MFRKILLATDGSESAKKAEKYAIELAKNHNAEITAMIVVDIYYAAVPVEIGRTDVLQMTLPDIIENEIKNGEKILDRVKQEAEKENVKVNKIVKIGRPDKQIVEESEKGYDVIVIGSKGLSGIKRYLLGSVAEHVVRYSKIPVLVVKSKEEG